MPCGVSTACFYPQQTVDALQCLQRAGVQNVEIFLNTFSELEEPFASTLVQAVEQGDTNVLAMHPFTSSMETFFFASAYEGRFEDGLRIYRRYCELCKRMNVPLLVLHGDYFNTQFPFKQHCANIMRLSKEAAEYGVTLCQENVVRCKCGFPEYVTAMREYTNDEMRFVLDIKQMRRANVEAADMLQAMQGRIAHLHLSDYDDQHDCVVPGTGLFDFDALFRSLRAGGFAGSMVVELYRHGFKQMEQLVAAAVLLDKKYMQVYSIKE